MNLIMLILGIYVSWQLLKLLWILLVALIGACGQVLMYLGIIIGSIFVFLWKCVVWIFKGLWIVLVLIVQGIWAVLSVVISVPVAIVEAIAVALGVTVAKFVSDIRWCARFDKWYWWKKNDEKAWRNYFFGPGYTKLINTLDIFIGDLQREAHTISRPRDARDKLEWLTDHVPEFCETLAWTIYMCFGFLGICIFGTVLGLVSVLFWGVVLTLILLLICIPVALAWIVDELGMWRRRPRSDCPVCKKRVRLPAFRCKCGRVHRRLRPGPYGILRHRCKCGVTKLPCTFLSGRAKVTPVCPACSTELAASDARPLVFQLAGGTRSGKTAYLSAFFHEIGEQIDDSKRLSRKVTDAYGTAFGELTKWYYGGTCPETVLRSGKMYPMLIDGLSVRRQLSVFDVTGNLFSGEVSTNEMPQLTWCDGLLLVIDPFCGTKLRKPEKTAVSTMSTETVVNYFIRHLTDAGHMKATARCTIPLAVLIAKADEPEVRRTISPARIAALHSNNPDQYAGPDEARDAICRQFLLDIGLNAAISELETQFTNIRYYPVSAQGHPSDTTAFEPWGVTEPVEWMLKRKDARLVKALRKK